MEERPVNPTLATLPGILPCRSDNIWTVPRFRCVIGGRSHTSSPLRRALLYRRRSRDRSCLPVEFYGRAFYICGAVPRRTENHVHIPRGINNSSVSIRVGFTALAVVAWLSRGREPRERKSSTMCLCAFGRSAHPPYKIKLSSRLPDCFATLFYLLSRSENRENAPSRRTSLQTLTTNNVS